MFTLSSSTTLTAVLAEAATTAPTITVTYSDVLLSSGAVASRLPAASAVIATTGTTPVTVVASPASGYAREVENIAFRNKDSVAHTVTFGGAIDLAYTVPAGQILTCDSKGSWRLGAAGTIALAGDVAGPSSANVLSTVPVAKGGTGAVTPISARAALGAAASGANADITALTTITAETITNSGATNDILNLINNGTSTSSYTRVKYTNNGGKTWTAGVGNSTETAYGVANNFYIYDSEHSRMVQTIDGATGITNLYGLKIGGNAVTVMTAGTMMDLGSAQTVSGSKTATATQYGYKGSSATLYHTDAHYVLENGYSPNAYNSPMISWWNGVPIGDSNYRVYHLRCTVAGIDGLHVTQVSGASPTILELAFISSGGDLGVAGNITGLTANTTQVGTASVPMAGGYFQTAPVVTSAQDAKINWRYFTDTEKAGAVVLLQKCPRLFQLKTSVAEKGADKARFHAGLLYEEAYAALQAAGFADADIERFSLFCASPAKKTVTKTRTVSRQKTEQKTRTVESIVVTDGVAVLTTTTETYDAPVYEALLVKDTSGAVVYEADGKAARTYQSPVMEDVAETYTEEEDDPDATPIRGIRYTELDTWYIAGLLKLNDDLTARVAALEAKVAA